MCGIVGWVKLEKSGRPSDSESLQEALIEASGRGTDATGIYTKESGVVKKDVPAKKFVTEYADELSKWARSDLLIGHTRAATSGFRNSPALASFNENNHPHEGERYVLVHNGHYGSLPVLKKYAYKGECDSELALSYIERFGPKRAIELMQDVDGFSLVFYDKVDDLLYFFRHKNPLVYSIDFAKKTLIFGSTSSIVDTLTTFETVNGFVVKKCCPFYTTQEDHLYTIKPKTGLIGDIVRIDLLKYLGAYRNVPEASEMEAEELLEARNYGKYGVQDRRTAVITHTSPRNTTPKAYPYDIYVKIGPDHRISYHHVEQEYGAAYAN